MVSGAVRHSKCGCLPTSKAKFVCLKRSERPHKATVEDAGGINRWGGREGSGGLLSRYRGNGERLLCFPGGRMGENAEKRGRRGVVALAMFPIHSYALVS